jgi:hypothetical protein
MPRYNVTAETPSDYDALRAMLRDRLKNNWPTKPDPTTIGTDVVALQALHDKLDAVQQTVDQLIELASDGGS